MKKLGILIFIIAIIVGVAFSGLFSFGRASGKLFTFSIGSSVHGSGNVASEVRGVDGFTGVDVSNVFEVDMTAGKDFLVEFHADDNLLPYIKTEVRGEVLHIETTEGIKSKSPLRVTITAPEISSINASGASKIAASGVTSSALEVDASGASKLKISGDVTEVRIDVSGASSVDAESLKSRVASVDASGASKVSVNVSERLASHASGASKISYSGNPGSVEKAVSGASKITQN